MPRLSSLSTAARGLRAAWSRRSARLQLRRELEESSDRALAEIGLCRGDISAVAGGRYNRD